MYVAGLRFWARRTVHHLAAGSCFEATPQGSHRSANLAGEPLSSVGVDQRPTRILAETDRYRITGIIFLPPDGYRSRLSDYLNTPEHTFLALTDVELTPFNGSGPPEQHRFLALSLQHIVFAVPLDEAH